MRQVMLKLAGGEGVAVYNGGGGVVLQVRRLVHGAEDPTAASFKSGVVLTPVVAARVAAELLTAAGMEAREFIPHRSSNEPESTGLRQQPAVAHPTAGGGE